MHDSIHTPGHPSDEQLFDLLAGTLTRPDEASITKHLNRCSACRAFVDAARAGTPAADQLHERLPADAAVAMHAQLASEFELRHGAAPTRKSALDVDAGSRFSAGASRGWRRWAIPVVAFVVVAGLAGVSVTQFRSASPTSTVDNMPKQQSTTQSDDSSSDVTFTSAEAHDIDELAAPTAGGALTQDSGSKRASKPDTANTAGKPTNLDSAPGSTPETALPEATSIPEDASAIPPIAQFEQTRICVLAFASAEHPFPDDRPITYVRQLALDLVIACG